MTEQEKEKKDVDSNRKKKLFKCFAVAAAALLLILAGYELIRIFGPNTTYTDLGAYLGLTSTDEYDLRIDDERAGKARKIEDEIYIPLETAASKVSSRFYYDGTEKGLIVVTPEGTVRAEEGSRALKILGSDRYISISFMEDNYPCSILRNEEGRTVWIITDFETEKSIKKSEKNEKMRVSAGIRGEIVVDIAKGDSLICLAEEGKYTLCIKEGSGLSGYVKTSSLGEEEKAAPQYTGTKKAAFDTLGVQKDLRIGWHMIDQYNQASQTDILTELLDKEQGLDIIIPTWLSVNGERGEVVSYADTAYSELAIKKSLTVWAMIDNFSREVSSLEVLKSKDARQAIINTLTMGVLGLEDVSGINVDFEAFSDGKGGLNAECGPHFLQFLRELTEECHKRGLIVSVDIPMPYSFNNYLDRKEIGRVVDLVIIMGYDEHYAGSDPGSVASYDFVKDGLEKTLADVPAEKTVLGVPFYTRQWTVDDKGNILGTRVKTQSEITEDIKAAGAETKWLEKERQFYSEFKNEFGMVKVWLDDETSIKWKMDMVREKGLAGAAAWRLGIETPAMWQMFADKG